MTAKSVLVIGATGGVGRPVAERLAQRGWAVRALHRNPPAQAYRENFEWVRGDATNAADVAAASRGVDVIVHAAKPRHYRDWGRFVLPMIDNAIAAADGARIVMPGNVYNYGPDAGLVLREDAPQNPLSEKGRLRVEMELRLQRAVAAGRAKALILRAGDFFGPGANSSWFSEAMVTPGRRPRVVRNPSKRGTGHQWTYLPDLAQTMVELIEASDLPDFARFHMEGHWDADGMEMAAAIVRVLGHPAVRVASLPWPALAMIAPFSRDIRELVELKPLWRRPLRLDNARLVHTLGREPHTPLDEAVARTLAEMRSS